MPGLFLFLARSAAEALLALVETRSRLAFGWLVAVAIATASPGCLVKPKVMGQPASGGSLLDLLFGGEPRPEVRTSATPEVMRTGGPGNAGWGPSDPRAPTPSPAPSRGTVDADID